MRSSAIILGMAALVAGVAIPAPQDFDFGMYEVLDTLVPTGPPVGGGHKAPVAVNTASIVAAAVSAGAVAAAAATDTAEVERSVEQLVKRDNACAAQPAG